MSGQEIQDRSADSDTIRTMRLRMLQIVVAVALLICLVCPVIDLFDHWDHAFQTGNETEYNLVVVALCVGVGVSLAQLVFRFLSLALAASLGSNLTVKKAPRSGRLASFFVVSIPLSPPPLALRI